MAAWHEKKTALDWFEELMYGSIYASMHAVPYIKSYLRKRQLDLVLECRRDGIPWDIAASLMSVSPQAVHQMWKRYYEAKNRSSDD